MAQNSPHILVVDDELSMRELLEYMLTKENYKVSCAQTGQEAIDLLEKDHFDLLLCDIRLGDITGLDVLRASKLHHPENAVILISAYATTETAVEAMNAGAYDYVPKPFDKDELLATIAKAIELRSVEHEKKQLDDELKKNLHFGMIVGNSPAMHHIYKLIEQVAKTKTNVLITGESGTGKEVIAKAIHQESEKVNAMKSPLWSSTAAASRKPSWKASCSAIKRERLPAPPAIKKDCLRSRIRAPFFWMKSAS
jgi:two-component system response regulator PilR (NtrC family)